MQYAPYLPMAVYFHHRYQFFLQVRRDILQGRLPVTFDLAAELCAYAVQCKCLK